MRGRGEHFTLPETHRIKGKLLITGSASDGNAAEATFSEAISVLTRAQAKLLNSAAAMSLAQLWRNQGKVQKARELLGGV